MLVDIDEEFLSVLDVTTAAQGKTSNVENRNIIRNCEEENILGSASLTACLLYFPIFSIGEKCSLSNELDEREEELLFFSSPKINEI